MTLDGLLGAAALRLAASGRVPGAFARARAAGMRAALSALLRVRHLSDALDALDAAGACAPPARDPEGRRRVLDALRRWHPTCLWRALAGYAALRARGEDVRFVVGVRGGGGELAAHAWLELDGAPLCEPRDPRAGFAVAFVHPPPAPSREERRMPRSTTRTDVILTELQDGTGVLLHLGTKFYYALNRTGVAAWKLVEEGVTDPDAIADAIAAGFEGATEAQARADVAALLAELRAEGLLPGGG